MLRARIAIVGGGIGGMALALALHDDGIDGVCVYEASPAVKQLGVGINVLPHAVRELTELGLLEELVASGSPPPSSPITRSAASGSGPSRAASRRDITGRRSPFIAASCSACC